MSEYIAITKDCTTIICRPNTLVGSMISPDGYYLFTRDGTVTIFTKEGREVIGPGHSRFKEIMTARGKICGTAELMRHLLKLELGGEPITKDGARYLLREDKGYSAFDERLKKEIPSQARIPQPAIPGPVVAKPVFKQLNAA